VVVNKSLPTLDEMNARTREIFRRLVESYLEAGDPVGSRTLTRVLSEKLSAATVRNVMQDLEHLGILASPHSSAGRIPTQLGLRLFVDGLLEIGDLGREDQQIMDATLGESSGDVGTTLDRIGSALSVITRGASLVLAPKHEAPIKHIEFIGLGADRALVILVMADGHVENRLFSPPPGYTPSSMQEATNFLNSRIEHKTLSELQRGIKTEIHQQRQEIDTLARGLIENGIAVWSPGDEPQERLIVRGRSNLLAADNRDSDLERIRSLFDDLERKRNIVEFLDLADRGEGVRIFIGSENRLFSLSGSSLIVCSYTNAERKIAGAVGVIGPQRLNYGRIVPIVDYTAQLIEKVISDPK